jgi:hypothetical protein
MQVTLNTRQHVMLNVGVRVPVNARAGRARGAGLPALGLVRRGAVRWLVARWSRGPGGALAAAAGLWIAVVRASLAVASRPRRRRGRHEPAVSHFETADTCMACHNGL